MRNEEIEYREHHEDQIESGGNFFQILFDVERFTENEKLNDNSCTTSY